MSTDSSNRTASDAYDFRLYYTIADYTILVLVYGYIRAVSRIHGIRQEVAADRSTNNRGWYRI